MWSRLMDAVDAPVQQVLTGVAADEMGGTTSSSTSYSPVDHAGAVMIPAFRVLSALLIEKETLHPHATFAAHGPGER